MTGKGFYQLSLMIPLAVPLAAAAITANSPISAVLLLSLVFGGIPYSITAFVIYLWSKKQNALAIRRLSYFTPILFIPVMGVLYLVWLLTEGASPFDIVTYEQYLQSMVLFSVYILLIGYFYVLIVNFIYELFFSKHEH